MKRVFFDCNSCQKKNLKSSQVDIDHIIPVVDTELGFVDWNNYIPRLFTEEDGYQVLCKECHQLKSNNENQQRK